VTDATQDLIRIHIWGSPSAIRTLDFDGVQPAPISASIKAMRAATLTGVFSFCSRRAANFDVRTNRSCWSREAAHEAVGSISASSTPSLHDIADLAFYHFQHACEGRTQGLLIFITSA